MNEKFPQEARKIMDERFGQDTLLSLATTDPNIRYDIDFSGNWRLLKSKMDDFGGGEEDGLIGYRGSEGECGRIADNLKDFWGKRSRKWFRFVWSATSLIDEYLYFRLSSSQGKEGEQCFWESSSCLPETGFTRTLYLPIIRQRTRSHTLILLKRFRNFRSKRFSGAS